MKQACLVLEEIGKVSSRNKKIELLRSCGDSEELKFLLETAMNPFLTYGVSDFDEEVVYSQKIPSLKEVRSLRDALVTRELSGNKAREEMRKLLLCNDIVVKTWLVRAFKKDLKAGIAESSVAKVFSKLIPKFEIGLCETYDSVVFGNKLPEGCWGVEPKFDGLRCLIFVSDQGDARFVSRNGKDMYNTELIAQEIKKSKCRNCVIDGEMYAGDWNTTISVLHTEGEHRAIEKLKFYVFDYLLLSEWESKRTAHLRDRKDRLVGCVKGDTRYVELVQIQIVGQDYEKALKWYGDIVDWGYEGVVLKNLDSEYPFGRSSGWLKWKPTVTHDVVIVSWEQGTGRHVNRLGAFVCNFNGKLVRVGGGFSDLERDKFWLAKESMVGDVLEVKAQEVTKDGALRFPVFVRLRKDKNL